MSPEELAALVASLAIAISKDKSTDEIDLLAVILSQVSGTLATISIQRRNLDPDPETNIDPSIIIS